MAVLYNEASATTGRRSAADRAQWQKKKDLPELFRAALREKGVTLPSLIGGFWRTARGAGKLTIYDYFRYRLYRPGLSEAERERFLSDRIHWPICDRCSDVHWRAATEDKWLSYTILQQAGVPIPKLLSVFDPSGRSYGQTRTSRNADELERFFAETAAFPMFVKPNDLLASFGTCVIEGFDGVRLNLHDGSQLTPREFIDEILGQQAYLFQNVLENHTVVKALAKNLATLRLINFVRKADVYTPYAVLKIPSAENIADNFWRAGNMLADVDAESGVIRRVVRGTGPDLAAIENGTGVQLPMWDSVRALNERVARIFSPVAYNSLDIGITPEGPLSLRSTAAVRSISLRWRQTGDFCSRRSRPFLKAMVASSQTPAQSGSGSV